MTGGREDGKATRERIMQFLKEFIATNHYPPSYREICAGTGLHSTSAVSSQIKQLIIEGKIRREYGSSRSISIVEEKVS